MRLFFALELPESLRAELDALVEALRPLARGVRWVRAGGMHLTVRFLGEVEDDRQETLAQAGRAAAARSSPPRLRSGALGAFPARGLPRVIWLGVEDADGSLGALHQALETALEGAGFGRESRPFSPHLTLGRVRPGADPRRALEGARAFPPREFRPAELVLMQSFLDAGGARYDARQRLAIGGGA